MTDQPARYDHFASLHVPGNPVVLFNVWDVGSALAVQRAGAKAIATGSHSVAEARGYEDGENTPLDFVIANAARIAEAVDVPVTIDFEAGYGGSPEAVAASLAQLLETGIVGVNIEDGLFGAGIRPVGEQVLRLKALSAVRASSGAPAWLNARTDVFLVAPPDTHHDQLPESLERAAAYAEAGANSYFIPGLTDLDLIARVCEAVTLPVNVMATAKSPTVPEYAAAGVARVSYGGHPWRLVMKNLADEAEKVLQQA